MGMLLAVGVLEMALFKLYLYGTSEQVAIMRQTSGEWWTIIEREGLAILGELQRSVERIDITPELQNLFFLLREIELP